MTATQTAKEIKASELFDRIQNRERLYRCLEGHSGEGLGTLLRQAGYKSYSTGSCCSVASYEANLKLHGSTVHIIESDFFGRFTQVTVR